MNSFDIIESASKGYRLVWEERGYLVKLAAVPFLIKMVCFTAVALLGWEQHYLRQALVLLPSYFADGWLVAHLVRFIMFEQRWPFRPTGDTEKDMQVLEDRALGVMRGTLMFVVIQFLMAGITHVAHQSGSAGMSIEGEQATSLGVFFLALAFFIFFFWAFRLVWLYIPAAMNYPIRHFLIDLGGYSASWNLIGTWLLCFLPAFLILGKLLTVIVGSAESAAAISFETHFLIIFVQVILDIIVSIIATAGMAYGFINYVLPKTGSKKKSKQ